MPVAPDAEVNVKVNVDDTDLHKLDGDAIAGVLEYLPELVTEAKAGYKTTEFWITVATGLLIQLNAIPMPEKVQGYVQGGLAIAYILSRGVAKSGVPVPVTPPA